MVSGKRFERAKALFRGWQCMRQADGRSVSLARAGQGRSITALGPVAFRRMDGIAGATIPGLRSLWHRPKKHINNGRDEGKTKTVIYWTGRRLREVRWAKYPRTALGKRRVPTH